MTPSPAQDECPSSRRECAARVPAPDELSPGHIAHCIRAGERVPTGEDAGPENDASRAPARLSLA